MSKTWATTLGLVSGLVAFSVVGCASDSGSGGQRTRVVPNPESTASVGGIPPDKEAEG